MVERRMFTFCSMMRPPGLASEKRFWLVFCGLRGTIPENCAVLPGLRAMVNATGSHFEPGANGAPVFQGWAHMAGADDPTAT